MEDTIEETTQRDIYLAEGFPGSHGYYGGIFHFKKGDPEATYSHQRPVFSEGFLAFIEVVKQARFDFQTNVIDENEAFQKLLKAEKDNGLPNCVTMSGEGIDLGGHVKNIENLFGYGDGKVSLEVSYAGCYDSGDHGSARAEAYDAQAKDIQSVAEMLDIYVEVVKPYDHNNAVEKSMSALSKAFADLGLPFDKDSVEAQKVIDGMVSQLYELSEPSGHVLNRSLVPGGTR